MTNKQNEKAVKLALLGGSSSEEKPQPKIGRLLMPLPKGAAIWCFCSTCGSYTALKKEGSPSRQTQGAKELAEGGQFKLPIDRLLKEYFIEVNYCDLCPPKDKDEIKLRKIEELEPL